MKSLFVACVCFCVLPLCAETVTPPQLSLDLSNPHQGFVFWGSSFQAGGTVGNYYDSSIFHVYIPWREVEPADQQFDWAGLEARRLQPILDAYPNATFLLRLVADYPNGPGSEINRFYAGGDPNRDYPLWLEQAPVSVPIVDYASCNGDGPGRNPEYNHPAMIAQMEELIEAYGEYFDGDERVTTIQAGLLGMWGEWHQFGCPDLQPLAAARMAVRDAYKAAFTKTPVQVRLMRDTDTGGAEFGVYEDYFPSFTAPCSWGFPLCGEYGDTILAYALDALPEAQDNWQRGAISGESPLPEQQQTWLNDTANVVLALETYHFSFLGPAGPHEDPGHDVPLAKIKRALGYQYHIASCIWPDSVNQDGAFEVKVELANTGSAPAYHDYLIEVALCDAAGVPVAIGRDPVPLRDLLPGATRQSRIEVSAFGLPIGTYSLRVAVIHSRTNAPGIRLQTAGVDANLRYPMGDVDIAEAAAIRLTLNHTPDSPLFLLQWESLPTTSYILEGTPEIEGSPWVLLHQGVAGGELETVDVPTNTVPYPHYFFRVRRE